MRILITGGQGYIGENLQLRYGNNGKYWFDSCDYGVVHPDLPLAHQLSFDDIVQYDAVVHLAALSGIIACEKEPMKAVQENILTAMNVFAHASKAGIPVVFTSSQAAKEPTSSKYAYMKWIIEQIAGYYNQSHYEGMNYVIRLSNVYGGHKYLDKKQTCVKQFIKSYNAGEPLEIHGDGKQTRDFLHVYDVCEAIMKVITFRPMQKDPIDIGTGIQTSIMEVQEMFPRVKNHHYKFEKTRSAGTSSSIANTSMAKELLHFVAKRRLNDYIKEMIS